MGDYIGSGSVTVCQLRSLGNQRRQTELHYIGWTKNKNKQNLKRCHHPLITQLNDTQMTSYLRHTGYFLINQCIIYLIKPDCKYVKFLLQKQSEIIQMCKAQESHKAGGNLNGLDLSFTSFLMAYPSKGLGLDSLHHTVKSF